MNWTFQQLPRPCQGWSLCAGSSLDPKRDVKAESNPTKKGDNVTLFYLLWLLQSSKLTVKLVMRKISEQLPAHRSKMLQEFHVKLTSAQSFSARSWWIQGTPQGYSQNNIQSLHRFRLEHVTCCLLQPVFALFLPRCLSHMFLAESRVDQQQSLNLLRPVDGSLQASSAILGHRKAELIFG